MDFKEFVNKLEQDLKDFLSDTSPGAQVRQTPVEKLQAGSYTGISITPADTNVGMNINADQLYAQMQEGRSYEGVLAMALSQVEHGMRDMPAVDIQSITNYETARNLLCFEVVGTEQNADMLANIPHTDMENMSMVYRLQLDSNAQGTSTILITNAMIEQYGITKDQLHADAMENAPEIRPASFKTMAEVMAEMMGMPVEMMPQDMAPPMYVATNEDKVQGAAVMFYPDFMDRTGAGNRSSTGRKKRDQALRKLSASYGRDTRHVCSRLIWSPLPELSGRVYSGKTGNSGYRDDP